MTDISAMGPKELNYKYHAPTMMLTSRLYQGNESPKCELELLQHVVSTW